MLATKTVALGIAALLSAGSLAHAQVRIAQWNITNWSTSSVAARGESFKTAIYGVAPNGEQMAPDIMIIQEIIQGGTPGSYPISAAYTTTGQASVNAFLNLLNTAPGSPGDWAAAAYVPTQGDTGNALFYRTSKVSHLSTTTLGCGFANAPCGGGGATIDVGPGPDQSPRDNQRWLVHLSGYAVGNTGADLYLYSGHLKASDGSAEQARKVPEATRVRADAAALPTGSNFIFGADFNVQTSSRNYYQILIGGGAGQFFDPINKPGSWNNNSAFANIHTQEPATQMDDRHDQLLISGALRDSQGMSYIPAVPGGNILVAFNNTSWSDNNHSYRCWGNDGNHSGGQINTAPTNSQVGQVIADALVTTVDGNGHLGVYLDLQVPAKLGAPSGTINLGTVSQNASITYTLNISNAADLAKYSKNGTGWGIDPLSYSLGFTSGSGFTIPSSGPFERAAGPGVPANAHIVTLNTATPGTRTATLTITTDDPENPTRVLTFTANITAATTGACCVSAGTCTSTTPAGCSAAFQGLGTVCNPNPCPQPTGACCAPAGTCTITSQATCTNAYQGDASVCNPNPCPQPTGACCTTAGTCTTTTQAACTATYQGNGTSCTPNICPSPSGACCIGTSCTITTQIACSGTFQGASSICGPFNNPTTCCPANYNGNSGLTIDDIFGFLGGWFNSVPRTDFNRNGTVDVQDIFDFLTAWFAGC